MFHVDLSSNLHVRPTATTSDVANLLYLAAGNRCSKLGRCVGELGRCYGKAFFFLNVVRATEGSVFMVFQGVSGCRIHWVRASGSSGILLAGTTFFPCVHMEASPACEKLCWGRGGGGAVQQPEKPPTIIYIYIYICIYIYIYIYIYSNTQQYTIMDCHKQQDAILDYTLDSRV